MRYTDTSGMIIPDCLLSLCSWGRTVKTKRLFGSGCNYVSYLLSGRKSDRETERNQTTYCHTVSSNLSTQPITPNFQHIHACCLKAEVTVYTLITNMLLSTAEPHSTIQDFSNPKSVCVQEGLGRMRVCGPQLQQKDFPVD